MDANNRLICCGRQRNGLPSAYIQHYLLIAGWVMVQILCEIGGLGDFVAVAPFVKVIGDIVASEKMTLMISKLLVE